MPPIRITVSNLDRKEIADLHAGLTKLRLPVDPAELRRNELGASTTTAIGDFQRTVGLPADGTLTPETVTRLNAELEHRFFADSKTRTAKIQELLARAGHPVDAAELKSRNFGESTRNALAAYQAAAGLPQDSRLSDALVSRLEADALSARLSTKTQVGGLQRTLLRAIRMARLDVQIDPAELRQKQLGASTRAAIQAFQRRYQLPPTGEIDPATMARIESVAASRPAPPRLLKVDTAQQLQPINRTLRLNMANQHVGKLQQALAFLGYPIDEKEFKTRTFGATTREAVIAYQKKYKLPANGHLEGAALRSLNARIELANPESVQVEFPHRIRGSVRDHLWRGQAGLKVQVWEKLVRGDGAMLAERPSGRGGFFDIPYDPPRDPVDKQIKEPYHLQVKVVGANNAVLDSKVLFNPTLIAWVNFTQGADPYRGTSEYEQRMKAVSKVTGNLAITDLAETAESQEITHVAINSGLSTDDIMRLALSGRAARSLGTAPIGPEVFYAFIRQNLPATLPSDLLGSTQQWALIAQLVDLAVNGVVFADPDLQAQAFDNAVTENLIPIAVGRNKTAILAELATLRQTFALEKPVLIGNGNLRALLDTTPVGAANYPAVATAFLRHTSFGPDFWADARSRPNDFGGVAALDDLETTISLGEITKNFLGAVTFLKTKIADPNVTTISSARDLAKLDHAAWVQLIQENGGRVPLGTDGATAQAQVDTYAATLAAQSERLFPSIAFVAEVGRSNQTQLTKVPQVQKLLDDQPELDLRTTNIDAFAASASLNVPEDVLTQTKVLQRVQRIAPNAAIGRALLDQRIHSASQVLSLGKEQLVDKLKAAGVDQKTALTVYGVAEFQYAQALQRLTDYRFELHRTDPKAIIPYTYTKDELTQLAGAVPNLEVLFGPIDACDCPHCESVLGPPAYLADLLRFLDAQPSEQANKTVREVLFDRRPDIGNLKLNCDNTDVALPYIDLVCEVLESLIPAPNPDPGFSFQTTRPQNELRAFPEHARKEAYDLLKNADFPVSSSFDLWQEEARVYLNHLGVPRHELMTAFQARPQGGGASPSDVSIAGEYWGISSHETDLITTAAAAPAAQTAFWGFDATQPSLVVSAFLERGKIDYQQLLSLLYVEWLNPTNAANRLVIQRPVDTCSTDEQTLTNLAPAKLDQMHRFLRLWRRTSWRMWELDLLLRAPKVGNGTLDGAALVELMRIAKLQQRLGLDVESTLALYGDMNTESRAVPENPQKTVPPLYLNLFQNTAITSPVDPAFALPIASGENLADHPATLIAALEVTEADLGQLLPKTDGSLTLANLSKLFGYAALARGLRLRVADLLTLLGLTGVAEPLASPQQTLDLIDWYGWITASGFQIPELDFLLNHRPDSPYGLRDEVVVQGIEALRESLRSSPAAPRQGQIIAQVGSAFALTDEQAAALLQQLRIGGPLIGHFQDPNLIAVDASGQYTTPVTEASFPQLFQSYRLLHKASMLVKKHALTGGDELSWFLTNAAKLGTLAFSDLPVAAPPAQPLFPAWLALSQILDFKRAYPEPEGVSLTQILALAANPASALNDILSALATLTTWKVADLQALHAGLQLQHGASSDYARAETYLRLRRCFQAIKRLGVDATQPLSWALRDDDTNDRQLMTAQQVRQAAKARYDSNAWLTVATPLQDDLREKKRDALVAWLVEHAQRTEPAKITVNGKDYANPRRWHDESDLLGYVLIDVEMNACQLTSRVKQAISSVQMFVQRCFLNLEAAFVQVSREALQDTVSLNSWKQWQWTKSYRIWEANRKVFLYPENWILPELRDDKSPFFTELESELLQGDITDERAEDALLHYLEKVHEVARLDITGIYYEVDDDNPHDNLPPNINVVHVVGRTRSQPAVYYYRQYDMNYGTWTAWERIDLEISGDQVIPVVHNRRLHLFWLVFTEKPQKTRKQPPARPSTSDKPQNAPDPPMQLEIQLAWSVRTKDGWTAKKLSHERLVHPWQRPLTSYNLKPRYKPRENLLWLDIYISTSREFNDTLFYDQYADPQNALTHLTALRFDETARPWHSSSFVFDGDVVDVKMKGLAGLYRVMNANGQLTDTLYPSNSYQYVHDAFGVDGDEIDRLSGPYEIAPRLALPSGMHFRSTKLRNNRKRPNPSQLSVLEAGASVTLLRGARSPFELVFSQHAIQMDTAVTFPTPLVYQDPQRSFFIKPEWQQVILGYNRTLQQLKYTFYPFYHPYTALFTRELKRSGLEGLLNRKIQLAPQTYYPGNSYQFAGYSPAAQTVADASAATDIVDFNQFGAYGIYNWELFFHAPLLIASRLSQNRRFEEAMRWFHFIFDPTNTDALSSPQRFWVTKPFYEQNSDDYRKQRITELLKNIGANLDQLRAWKNNPFKPHLIARYRPVAYQKTVVMKYIDNLIAWGDQLFRQDTIESINEATSLYLLAYEILGPRPSSVPNVTRQDLSYNELTANGALDPFGNKQVDVLMENFTGAPVQVIRTADGTEPMPKLEISYFGIPENDTLLGYWDVVADRLFKIRNCMNIAGVVRRLPLFEPPIDPALLVKAAAAGIDLSTVLSETAAPMSQYRCRVLIQKALELTQDVRVLGDKLLSVIEKGDAEGLALLRSSNEIELLQAVRQIRQSQIDDAQATLAGLEKAQALAQERKDYYTSRDFINAWEGVALGLNSISALAETGVALGYILAGGLTLIPKFVAGASGFGGSPHVTAEVIDGFKFSRGSEMAVQTLSAIARASDKLAALSSTIGSYRRRADDWDFQGRLAGIEIDQIQKQIDAAAIRVAVAERELENHGLQITEAQSVDDYLHSKYSNQQLYGWMLGQISTVYFQCYQLAYDMAKRAERSFQFELGRQDGAFIQFGYWDGLKKGLLAGERLANDLRRLEAAYYDRNIRTFELTKHVSLATVDPLALMALKETGGCTVTLPEWLYDMDYPGQLRRQIKSVSISIPCVVGPYTGVNCTLSLTNNGVRVKDGVAGGYGDPLVSADDRFVRDPVPIQSIATSDGQNDAGMFELNFNDERFLPFEGAGAVSQWRIDLPQSSNQFDFATVSDVVLHIRYRAEAGSQALVTAARDNLSNVLPNVGLRLLVLNREFSTEWQRFLMPTADTDQQLTFTLERNHLPFYARNAATIRLSRIDLIAESTHTGAFDVQLQLPGATSATNETMPRDAGLGQVHHLVKDPVVPPRDVLGAWSMKIKKDSAGDFRSLAPNDLREAYLVIAFTMA
ncbi:MAG TPA: neuraminidase-like domain-containing protein [Actinomycetes bacterium]|jgi:peptidoglycan hydrolase-like protein with peptidoglycan-binding domain|nr:neuraminidase-like domain-containing protein [Actinomycetes bacterium]